MTAAGEQGLIGSGETVCSFFYEFEMKARTKEADMQVGGSPVGTGRGAFR